MKRANQALVLGVLLALGLVWKLQGAGPSAPGGVGAAQLVSPTRLQGSDASPELLETERFPTRAPIAEPAPPAAVELPAQPRAEQAPTLVNGRVLDPRGVPLVGIRLALRARSAGEVATSAADGRFEFPLPREPVAALASVGFELEVAAGQSWTSALGTPFTKQSCTDLLVVAAPSIELGGMVTDESGYALPGAQLRLEVSVADLRDFPLALDRSSPLLFRTTSAAAGAFHCACVPALAGCKLRAVFGDALRGELDLPLGTALDLRLVLRASAAGSSGALTGIVLSSKGQPVAGATVRLESCSTKSAADGRFELVLPPVVRADSALFAFKKGFQPARVDSLADRIAGLEHAPLTLRLGPATLEIRGRVLLSDGTPARRWAVALENGTEVSPAAQTPLTAESLAAGERAGADFQETNSRGEFTLGGLSPRDYNLRAWSQETLLSVRAEGVAAGTEDLLVSVPDEASWAQVRGRVVDLRGLPVAGAQVVLELLALQREAFERPRSGPGVRTGNDGSFLLTAVPKRDVRLTVSGDSLIDQHFDIADLRPEGELRLAVPRRCHLRLVCAQTEGAPDRAVVLDERGERLPVFTFQDRSASSSTEVPVHAGGATHALSVSEAARTLVLFRADQEVARLVLELLPGEVTDVHF